MVFRSFFQGVTHKSIKKIFLLATLLVHSVLMVNAQDWEVVKAIDFENPSDYYLNLFSISGNGATGLASDKCAVTTFAGTNIAYVRMQETLEAGVNYRIRVNAKGEYPGVNTLNFTYGIIPNLVNGYIDQGLSVPHISINEPGADVVSSTFMVSSNGNYNLSVFRSGQFGWVRFDNFILEREALPTPPNFVLTQEGEIEPITDLIILDYEETISLCLTPDVAPESEIAIDIVPAEGGDGSPHYPNFSETLTFPEGETGQQCFTLQQEVGVDLDASYVFNVEYAGEVLQTFELIVFDCEQFAGPDREICAGEPVQLGTGCLPEPHPLDSLDYCYHWEPAEGLSDIKASMPMAIPEETTTYVVYVTTSGGELIASDSVTVTIDSYEINILPTDPSICYKEPVLNNISRSSNMMCEGFLILSLDDTPSSIIWSNGSTDNSINILEPGTYSVTVTGGNACQATDEVEVKMCTEPSLEITSCSSQLCEDVLTLSVANDFMSYTWSDGSEQPEIAVFNPGIYSITVEDVNGCIGMDSILIEECNPVVDISIYNGFYDWVLDSTWSGGQKVESHLEYEKGAITIANLNDTDGDSIPDNEDMSVTASLVGRNEIDLMRLDIPKPIPYCGGKLKLKVLEGKERVKLWNQPTKIDSLGTNADGDYEIDFSGGVNTKTVYVEAINYSGALKDIVIEASYYNKDTVSATAFWAIDHMVFQSTPGMAQVIAPQPTNVTQDTTDCPYTPTPVPNPLIQIDNSKMFSEINCKWIASNMTRYGFGLCRSGPFANFDQSSNDKWIAGKILWEFQILPTLSTEEYEDYKLNFDVTRQRKVNTQKIITGTGIFTGTQEDFPWEDQLDNEKPNDDSGFSAAIGSNDNTPSSIGMIYSLDTPGSDIYDLNNELIAFKAYRANFKEYVRMRINGFETNTLSEDGENEQKLEGSRASPKMDWYTYFNIVRNNNGTYKMVLDVNNTSVSVPVKVSNTSSNGTITLNVFNADSVSTNGYLIEFINSSSQTWKVSRLVTNTPINTMTIVGSWNAVYEGVSISISEGNAPFSPNEHWKYSTFDTQNQQGKVNQMGVGPPPYPINSPF